MITAESQRVSSSSMSDFPIPRKDVLKPPSFGAPLSDGGGTERRQDIWPIHDAEGQKHNETPYEQRGRQYREEVMRRSTPSHRPSLQQHAAPNSEVDRTLFNPYLPSSPSPLPLLRLATSSQKLAGAGNGVNGVEASVQSGLREWVETLVLERERLRQQLREAGLDPCC